MGQVLMLGTAVALNWLLRPKQTMKGPRPDDSQFTISSYGQPIPIGYGTIRIAGHIIWKSTVRVIEHREKVGKGGGVYSETYEPICDLAIAFADREAAEYLKFWANGELIYDATETGSATTEAGINITEYLGTDSQEPDSTIESHEGSGNVPAYRGVAYVVFTDFSLMKYGGSFPNIEALVSFYGNPIYPETIITTDPAAAAHTHFCKDWSEPYMWWNQNIHNVNILSKINSLTLSEEDTSVITAAGTWNRPPWGLAGTSDRYVYWTPLIGNYNVILQVQKSGGQTVKVAGRNSSFHIGWDTMYGLQRLVPATVSGRNIMMACSFNHIYAFDEDVIDSSIPTYTLADGIAYPKCAPYGVYTMSKVNFYIDGPVAMFQDAAGNYWFVGNNYNETKAYIVKVIPGLSTNSDPLKPGSIFEFSPSVTEFAITDDYDSSIGGIIAATYDSALNAIICFCQRYSFLGLEVKAFVWDIDSESVSLKKTYADFLSEGYSITFDGPAGFPVMENDGTSTVFMNSGGSGACYRIRLSDLEITDTYDLLSNWTFPATGYFFYYDATLNGMYVQHALSSSQYFYYFDRKEGGPEDLADVVEDLCLRSSKLIAADVDVSDLAGHDVKGFRITRQMEIREAIRQLAFGYLFYGVTSDWKIIFKFLEQASSFSITSTEVGVDGSYVPEELNAEEAEIPYKVIVKYRDENQDYQVVAQEDQRSTNVVNSRDVLESELDIVFTADEARQLAQKILYNYWVQANEIKVTSFISNVGIDPGDIGTIEYDDLTTLTVRVMEQNIGEGWVTELSCAVVDIDVFTSDILGESGGATEATITLVGSTKLYILDLPLLRPVDESDQEAVVYALARGYQSGWPGCKLYYSDYETTGYIYQGTLVTKPTWGYATNVLGVTFAWSTWDRYKTLTVNMQNGTPESFTEIEVLNGSGYIALQSGTAWEIIQYQTATDNGDGTYTLSDLLRCRRGTDYYQSGHAIGDVVLWLSTDWVENIFIDTGEIGNVKFFKAPTITKPLETATPLEETFYGRSKYPFSPADIRGVRDGSNNLTITWQRRTRVSGEWLDGSGTVPLGEDSEEYKVEIILAGSVIRTYSSIATNSQVYSAADQTTDGITPGDDITVRIYQVSALVGDGYYKEATI